MKNLFSIDSKVYQFLIKVSEVIFLNLLYLLCCLPIVTVGAAQAGMMNAARMLRDKEDERSVYQAFFRGFASGFGKITVLWSICFAMLGTLAYSTLITVYYDTLLGSAPVFMAVIALVLLLVFQSMAVSFHSKFDCSLWQIVRSALFMILMHPFRALGIAMVIWAPIVLMLLDLNLFLTVTPAFIFVYFTFAFQFAVSWMERPFGEVEREYFSQKALEDDRQKYANLENNEEV